MAGVLFSAWQGEVVDNRGKPEADYSVPKKLAIPPEFAEGEPIKAFMGWDGFALMEAGIDVVQMCTRYVEAVQAESCGRCVPCRVGTRVIVDVLTSICEGRGKLGDLERIEGLAAYIKEGSKCQIGQTGLVPLLTALEHFRKSFNEAVKAGAKGAPANFRVAVTAPCMSACPTKLKIPKYIEEIAEGKPSASLSVHTAGHLPCRYARPGLRQALRVELQAGEHRRGDLDKIPEAVRGGLRAGQGEGTPVDPKAARQARKVAVLGAGPAGLSVAYYLRPDGLRSDRIRAPGRAGRHGCRRHPRLPPPQERPRLRGLHAGRPRRGNKIRRDCRQGRRPARDRGYPSTPCS